MAIVEMKRIDLLAMRQDQKKLLRAMQRMGCVEVTPISGENLEAYQKQDVTRLPQVEATMERLRAAVDELETITDSRYWPYPSYTDLLFSVK